jgi:hypothetical protein
VCKVGRAFEKSMTQMTSPIAVGMKSVDNVFVPDSFPRAHDRIVPFGGCAALTFQFLNLVGGGEHSQDVASWLGY